MEKISSMSSIIRIGYWLRIQSEGCYSSYKQLKGVMTIERRKKENQAIKATTSSVIGSTIEWYDFHIYGLTAALVFPALFFPSSDPLIGTIESLATFTLGFIARPVGGIIFGHFGDKIGRKSILAITLLLMGFATFIIGLLPTYETIGGWAPILLIALRLIQGIAVGGEWGGPS